MDEESSVYYTNDYVFVAGGKPGGNFTRNFQMIDKNSFKLIKTVQMKYPRSGPGLVQRNLDNNNRYIYILSGNINDQQDQEKCEYYNIEQNICVEIDDIIFKGRNLGCIFQDQSIIVYGGIAQQYQRISLGQYYDTEIETWGVCQQGLPCGSSLCMVRDEQQGLIYVFGEFLDFVYTLKWNEDDAEFTQVSQTSYPGEPSFQSPILEGQFIHVYDGSSIHTYDIVGKTWSVSYDELQKQHSQQELDQMISELQGIQTMQQGNY